MFRFAFLCSATLVILFSISVSATAQVTRPITATEGSQFLTLSTFTGTFDAVTGLFPPGVDSGIDRNGNGNNEQDIAVLSLDFSALAGQTVSFDYNFLTAELPVEPFFADAFEVSLNGTQVVAGAVGINNGAFPQLFGFDALPVTGPDSSFFASGQLGFLSASATTAPGINTLEFFVGDDFDNLVESALLVDNILLDGQLVEGFETAGPLADLGETAGAVSVQVDGDFTQVVPEPSGVVMMLGFGIAALSLRRR